MNNIKRPKYKKRYELFANIAVVASLIALLAILTAIAFYQAVKKSKEYAESLLETQNIMIWQMDESCYQQLQGSEGIIRLDIKKVGEN